MSLPPLPAALADLPARIHTLVEEAAQAYPRDPVADPLAAPLYEADETRLMVAPLRQGWHVEYFGEPWGEAFDTVLATLCRPEVAKVVGSLAFSGPDTGANGTREWTFEPLLASEAIFPRLRTLFVKPTAPEDHNASVICAQGAILDEAGDIARWAHKTPRLSVLTVPTPPRADFFAVPLPHLVALQVGGHFDTQGFIRHLAQAEQLPALTLLDVTECTEQQRVWPAERAPGSITPFADYEALLAGPVGERLRVLRLRNTCLDLGQLQQLQAVRPRLQFMVIQSTTGGYVSHFAQDVFPWRHLVPADPGLSPHRESDHDR